MVVGDAEVAGVEEDDVAAAPPAAEAGGCPAGSRPARGRAFSTIRPGGCRASSTACAGPPPAPRSGPTRRRSATVQRWKSRSGAGAAPHLGHQALGVKIGDRAYVSRLPSRRSGGRRSWIRKGGLPVNRISSARAQLPAQPPDQPEIGPRRPQRPGAEVRAVVDRPAGGRSAAPGARPLLLDRIGRRGEAGEDHVLPRAARSRAKRGCTGRPRRSRAAASRRGRPACAALRRSRQRRLALGEHLLEIPAHRLALAAREVPVDRAVEAVHELHPRLPAEESSLARWLLATRLSGPVGMWGRN